MTKNGAALDVYDPLVEKYTKMFGKPDDKSMPLTTNLSKNVSLAISYWNHPRGSVTLMLYIPLSGNNVPQVTLREIYRVE